MNSKYENDMKSWNPFFPNHFITEMMVVFGVIALIASLAVFFPAPVEEKADPFSTPADIKPEWYFLASYQFLKLIPNKFLGIFLQLIFIIAIILLPYIDQSPHQAPGKRLITMLCGMVLFTGLLALTLIGFKG